MASKKSPPKVVQAKTEVPAHAYTDEKFEAICERIAQGETLREMCREEGMPRWRQVYRWIAEDDEKPVEERKNLRTRFMRARDEGFDAIAEETLRIADDARNDWMEKYDKDGNNIGWQLNGEHVQRSKLRIETRLKLLAKWSPNKYGESVNLNHGGQVDNPIQMLIGQLNGSALKPIELPVEDAEDDDTND